ncbi:UDP-2,4-diacetamido-2,4,6-trideoxy-beta-L-altropyranose hydrolase [Psychrobacter alimentarius]|uniref:UDP-2,4-diacetamido-2,4, 6-trideoxy-beta-L-altropyranose hydrolase n=1 Tax=Psychrobacter alimentarius TaxID=261164 RepID=UPI001919F59F|nr:UDP-2,4-diacetamido-2,4,6-trideoxy-beta-L-altropyranose hydrolase [Psychrobacter alimentarius]
MKVIGFRVDAATHIGTGHLQRCFTLARKFDELGWRCIFFSRDYGDGILSIINESGFECHVIGRSAIDMNESNHFQWLGVSQEQDAIDTIKAINYQQLDIIIIDHYSIDYRWQQKVKEKCDVLLMVVDDLANRTHSCTLLVDQNFWPNSSIRYDGLVPNDCKRLLGPNFTMLRQEFLSLRAVTRQSSQTQTILVNFGGIGNVKVWDVFLPALIKCEKYNFHIVTGKLSSEDFEYYRKMTVNIPHIFLELETNQMSYLMKNSDFALGACGSTVWERFCLGLNAALIDVADNQKDLVAYLHTQDLVDYLGSLNSLTVDSIFDYLSNLSIDSLKYQDRRKNIMQLVDGIGADRVAHEVISIYKKRCE